MASEPVHLIEVRCWGTRVGAVALDPSSGFYVFEYDPDWSDHGGGLGGPGGRTSGHRSHVRQPLCRDLHPPLAQYLLDAVFHMTQSNTEAGLYQGLDLVVFDLLGVDRVPVRRRAGRCRRPGTQRASPTGSAGAGLVNPLPKQGGGVVMGTRRDWVLRKRGMHSNAQVRLADPSAGYELRN